MTRRAPLLVWEDWSSASGEMWVAKSGELIVGSVITTLRPDEDTKPHRWAISAVFTKNITKGQGNVGSVAQGRRSLARAWRAWLDFARLYPRDNLQP
jgi:hypothetical protein